MFSYCIVLSLLVIFADVDAQGSCSDPEEELTHDDAMSRFLSPANIPVSSSCGCSDRYRRCCTSLEGIRCKSVRDLVALKSSSGCDITVTGGTEIGHAQGSCSHFNGHKLDIRLATCINDYIQNTFEYRGVRGDGAEKYWDSSKSNMYYLEGNHWDICYNCPGCS